MWIHKARLVAKDAKQKATANAGATGAASDGGVGGGAAELPPSVAEAISKALKNARSYLQQGLGVVMDGKGVADSSAIGASPVAPRLEVLMCAELAKIYVQVREWPSAGTLALPGAASRRPQRTCCLAPPASPSRRRITLPSHSPPTLPLQTSGENAVQAAGMAVEMVERAMDVLESQPGLQLLNTIERRTALSVALAEAQEKAGQV